MAKNRIRYESITEDDHLFANPDWGNDRWPSLRRQLNITRLGAEAGNVADPNRPDGDAVAPEPDRSAAITALQQLLNGPLLSNKDRNVMSLLWEEEYTYERTAEFSGLSAAQVRNVERRVLGQLGKRMAEFKSLFSNHGKHLTRKLAK